MVLERLLQRGQLAGVAGEALDRLIGDTAARGLRLGGIG